MTLLEDVDKIIDTISTKENARKIDAAWTRDQIREFNRVYCNHGGPRQPTSIDMMGNKLEVGDWILCLRDTSGGGQTFELGRIQKFGKQFITIEPYNEGGRGQQIRPNAAIKTSIEGFQKIKQIFNEL